MKILKKPNPRACHGVSSNNSQETPAYAGNSIYLRTNPLYWLCVVLIKAYQLLLSPMFGRQCRFQPTCSHYALQALQRFGVLRGLYLTLWRLLSCQPWGGQGYSPIPQVFSWRVPPLFHRNKD